MFAQIRPRDLKPVSPAIAEPSTGESMGQSAEKMAKENHITREAQDELALMSHQRAAAATSDGRLTAEIAPWFGGPNMDQVLSSDNLIRADTSLDALAKLKPVFDRRYGSVTAGNASPLTDGASTTLVMAEEKARSLGYRPLTAIRSYAVAAVDPGWQLLMGPAYAVPVALKRAGITWPQLGLVEIHEAFAAQVLSNIQAWSSPEWAKRLGLPGPVGDVDWNRTNVMGGSIAVGHPFGATGSRLVTTLSNEMVRRDVAVRADLDLRAGRHGLRRGAGAGRMSAFTTQHHGGVAVVTLDTPHDAVNKVSNATRWELEDLLQRLESDELVKAIVIRSGKPDIFIAGADIEEFAALRSVEEATRLSKDGQLLMQRIADSAKPFVAAIHGACLGGGLELALACRYRVASDHAKTVLGFPEVQLGLIPGAGGSNRLPRLIGARAALDMILTSRNERGRKALALGLIDELVPEAILLETAVAAAERLSRTPRPPDAAWRLVPARRQRAGPPVHLSRGAKSGRAEDRRPLSRAAARHRGGADLARAWHGSRIGSRVAGIR